MAIDFYKYSATGNDFIVIDNRENSYDLSNKALWEKLCHRKTGVGADGVLFLEQSLEEDFKMRYLNSDGGEVEMCGNGARALTAFAHKILGLNKEVYSFETKNGIYECALDKEWGFCLKMTELYDVNLIDLSDLEKTVKAQDSLYLNTGVPHSVFEVKDIKNFDIFNQGKIIRYDERFKLGSNANFFEMQDQTCIIRTYERGVEDETLSCGTGAVATAIMVARKYHLKKQVILQTLGGLLCVRFNSDFSEVYLCGKVDEIFKAQSQLA